MSAAGPPQRARPPQGGRRAATSGGNPTALLEIHDLKVAFAVEGGGEFIAVDGVDLAVDSGRTLGIVGESGCGKSVTALSIMGLVPQPPGRMAGGAIQFDGADLTQLPEAALRELRGDRIAMIFQEPMTSLNPAFTVGDQIVEGIRRHRTMGSDEAAALAIEMLRRVHIPSPEQRFHDYPHRLSGGMRQRVMIAMALACKPQLLIADEPTTALDVTIQAQILDLMRMLREDTGTAIILITHDLGVVAELADDVCVMYAGRIVERARVGSLFERPQHPYTIGLLGSIPRLDLEQDRLAAIEGQVPNPRAPVSGCSFHPRCPFGDERCAHEAPPIVDFGDGHLAACWKAPLDAVTQA
jgi:peptide/nickel transport system ATP-binding protein